MLSNTQITNLIASQGLIKDHVPGNIQPASYDMSIGSIFRGGAIINQQHASAGEAVIITPGEVITMLTKEELNLPNNIAGTAYAMNEQSSAGLLVLNPGHVDPGYKGPLTVVALNLRKVDLPLLLGEKIFTVVFEELAVASSPGYSSSGKTMVDYERATSKKVVEKSVVSLKNLLSITKADINTQIRVHWLSWVVMASTIIAMIAAIIAAVFAVVPIIKGESSSGQQPTQLQLQHVEQQQQEIFLQLKKLDEKRDVKLNSGKTSRQ